MIFFRSAYENNLSMLQDYPTSQAIVYRMIASFLNLKNQYSKTTVYLAGYRSTGGCRTGRRTRRGRPGRFLKDGYRNPS